MSWDSRARLVEEGEERKTESCCEERWSKQAKTGRDETPNTLHSSLLRVNHENGRAFLRSLITADGEVGFCWLARPTENENIMQMARVCFVCFGLLK